MARPILNISELEYRPWSRGDETMSSGARIPSA